MDINNMDSTYAINVGVSKTDEQDIKDFDVSRHDNNLERIHKIADEATRGYHVVAINCFTRVQELAQKIDFQSEGDVNAYRIVCIIAECLRTKQISLAMRLIGDMQDAYPIHDEIDDGLHDDDKIITRIRMRTYVYASVKFVKMAKKMHEIFNELRTCLEICDHMISDERLKSKLAHHG